LKAGAKDGKKLPRTTLMSSGACAESTNLFEHKVRWNPSGGGEDDQGLKKGGKRELETTVTIGRTGPHGDWAKN